MADGTVGVKQSSDPDRLIDNEVVTNDNDEEVYRQKVAVTGLAGAPVSMQDANKQDALPYAEVLTASTTITPSLGKRLKVLKSQVLQSPANETFNQVTLGFASIGDFVTGWVWSDSTEWTGDVDEDLDITLSGSQPVSVNIRYKET